MHPTVAEVLALPVIRDGGAQVVAGSRGLPNRVRWVHVAEVADIAHLLEGGELVLTTGIALPDSDAALRRYVAELAEVGVAGLVIELVRRWSDAVPPGLRESADRHDLPLVTLSRETRYVAVTEAVNGLVVDAQVAELRAIEQIHETFTALTVSGADPAEVLRHVAQLTGAPVVLENLDAEVLAYDAATADPGELLAGWAERSRAVRPNERTGYQSGCLTTIVGARGYDWARLVVLCGPEPPHRHAVAVERAGSALAMHRLVGDAESLERHAHRTVLTDLLTGHPGPEPLARAESLGVPLSGRRLVGVSLRPRLTGTEQAGSVVPILRELAESAGLACRRARVAALVAVLGDLDVRALLSLTPQANPDAVLDRFARETRSGRTAVVAAGTVVDSPADARRTLTEAMHVAAAAEDTERVNRLSDVRLRGLLRLLSDDDRVRAFADRELGPLLARDTAQGTRLVSALRYFCAHGGNKSAAAAAAHVSRTAYYHQLSRIEQVLGVSLEDPESVLSLSVALLALDVRE